MIVLKGEDNAFCDTTGIHFTVDDKDVMYDITQLDKASILTTNRGPFEDDVALALFVDNEIFIIKSEHRRYSSFIFDELGKAITLDYNMLIESSVSTDNAEFIIFAK